MAGIDYKLAPIDVREGFSFTKTMMKQVYSNILKDAMIFGTVIISTCNRTEIYISCEEDFYVNPFEVLCNAAGIDFAHYEKVHRVKTGDEVIKHLCQLACGVKSQIWGEDQIITQVKNAIAVSREMASADSYLEVMFRNAIAAAKKVKSTLILNSRENSIVYKALKIVKNQEMMDVKEALVIGNGEIGRLMTNVLIENGYSTTMTLRQYRYHANIIPPNANTVDYSNRYQKMNDCDVVISATLSPHYTVEMEILKRINKIPKLFIDLAVPRDIDPSIKSLPNIEVYDVDGICEDEISKNHAQQLKDIEKIIEKYICDYNRWCAFKKGLVCI